MKQPAPSLDDAAFKCFDQSLERTTRSGTKRPLLNAEESLKKKKMSDYFKLI